MAATPVSDDLRRIAAAHGVATYYRNERREPVHVDADVIIKTLGLLDVDAGTEAARAAQLLIEYDPQPPFDSGALAKADPATVARADEYLAARQ